MEKLNFKSITDRVSAETPKFWKKIRMLMIASGSIGGALIALPAEYISFLPGNMAGTLITIGTVGAALASMTVSDNKKPDS